MARKKKKAVRSIKPHERKSYRLALKKAVENFWIAEGDIFPEPVLSSIRQDAVVRRWRITKQSVLESLHYLRWDWQLVYMAFCVDEFGNEYPRVEIEAFPNSKQEELEDKAAESLKKLCQRQNPKHIVSHGYFATPSSTADIEAMTEEVVAFFEEAGAYDRLLVSDALSRKVDYTDPETDVSKFTEEA